jgi:UDP-N-acetylmuramoylalanine--D-glutamate ligase
VRPYAGAVLNIAEDHLDWHGSMSAYVAAKARALSGRIAVVGLDDPIAAALARRPRPGRTVGFRLDVPADGELGVVDRKLLDRAFGPASILAEAGDISPAGPSGVLDALAAGALARAYGVAPNFVRDGLRSHTVGPHRAAVVRELAGVSFVDDSKATNPHAARSSVLAHDRVVWIAGGQLKGAAVDDLVTDVADRLAGAVLLGADAPEIAAALARHAPDVPVVPADSGDDSGMAAPEDVMRRAVCTAAGLARAGDTVLLAPAAASLDMFRSYGHRGESFAAAVAELAVGDIGVAR